jgi:hypothetical protein
MLITALVILAAVVVVASGRGGELAYEHADHAPLDIGPVSAADVALLRPPSALWGYNMQVTDEALDRIARAMSERDIQIAALQQQVADLQAAGLGTATPSSAARHAARSEADQLESDRLESGSSAESWLTGDSLGGQERAATVPYPPTLVSAAQDLADEAPDTPAPMATFTSADTSGSAAASSSADTALPGDADDAVGPAHASAANGRLAEPGAAQEAETGREEADSAGESAEEAR